MTRFALVALCLLAACREKPSDAPKPKAPAPFAPLVADGAKDGGDPGSLEEREALHVVGPFTPGGPAIPAGVTRLELHGEMSEPPAGTGPLLLVPDADTFLVQIAPMLTKLADGGREVWLKHPEADFAYQLTLRDEPQFQTWLEEAVPGKLRIIQRSDGFELQTNMGKLPGGDPNGPTVPARGGTLDLPTLRRGLLRIKARFDEAPDVCLMPSFGTTLADAARALAANYPKNDQPIFKGLCMVYPRPKTAGVDAGK